MNQLTRYTRLLLVLSTLSFGSAWMASAQTTVLPEPIVTTIAGITTGSGNTVNGTGGSAPCTTVILNSAGANVGDGCLPTQAILGTLSSGDAEVDSLGNIYIAEAQTTVTINGTTYASYYDIRVIYHTGSALAAALIAANPQASFTPTPGRIYTLAGALTGNISAVTAGSPSQTLYHCGSVTSPSSPLYSLVATDTEGDGCPAALTRVVARGIFIDKDGNVILTHASTKLGMRVVYVGGTAMANLIKLLDPAVLTPQVGYIYQLGFNGPTGAEGDGEIATDAGSIAPRYVTTDSLGNVYLSDGSGYQTSATSTKIVDAADNIRMINATTGYVSTVAGVANCGNTNTMTNTYLSANGCGGPSTAPGDSLGNGTAFGFYGDGGPATAALLNYPQSIFVDQYNNLFIDDSGNNVIRVVYRGGTLAPLANQGITPIVGNIYTYAGYSATGGKYGVANPGTGTGPAGTNNAPGSNTDGTYAQNIIFSAIAAAGIDSAGNIYVYDSSRDSLYRIDAVTGVANILAGSFTAIAAGAYCTGSSGLKSMDNFGAGCPGLYSNFSGVGRITFDNAGNFYMATSGSATSGQIEVLKFSYNSQFPATAVKSSVTQPLAFTAIGTVATNPTTRTFTLQGAGTSEFTDAGTSSCTPTTALAVKATCVVNVTFTPADAGARRGTIQINAATGVVGSEIITGTGSGADLAIDNGTVSSLGTGLTPSGVAADLLGNVYVADSKAGQVLKGAASGMTLAPLVTGLKNPSQIAVDNAGDVYVADTGNNRILVSTSTGTTLASLGTGLSAPKGVAVDVFGNILIADTGNNRIVHVTLNGSELAYPLDSLATALSSPSQLAFDPSGNLYILDSGNQRIVEYNITTGIASPLILDTGVIPTALAIDNAGDIYVADSSSNSVLNYSAGATPGFSLMSGLKSPAGLAVDADANLFLADLQLTSATELRRTVGNITFPITNPGTTSKADLTVNNVGNAALNFTAPLYTVTNPLFALVPSTTNGCGAGIPYGAGSLCNFTATFSPVAAGNYTGTATFLTTAVNSATESAQLNAVSSTLTTPTTISLTVIPATGIAYSLPITLQAAAVCGGAPPTTGTFTLTVDGKTAEPPSPIGNGTVTFVLPEPFGTHQLTVTYSGGGSCESASAAVAVPVSPASTATSLTVTPESINGIANLLFTAVVSVVNQTATGQTGTVTIWSGPVGTGTVVCSGAIGTNTKYQLSCNTANTTPPTLNFANNSFTAVYSGSPNGNFLPSQSATIVGSTSDFIVAPVVSTFTVPQAGVGELNVNLVALYGSAGTVTATCSGLPINSVCRFTPVQTTLTSNEAPEAVLVQVYTNVSSTLASNQNPFSRQDIFAALSLPFGLGLLLFRRRKSLHTLAVLLLSICVIAGVSACGSGTPTLQTFSTLQTPTGTYALTLTFTGSNGLTTTHSVPTTFTVLPYSSPY